MSAKLNSSTVVFPPIYSIDSEEFNNPIQKIVKPASIASVDIEPYTRKGINGLLIHKTNESTPILGVLNTVDAKGKFKKVLLLEPISPTKYRGVSWLQHPEIKRNPGNLIGVNFCVEIESILQSWKNAFLYKEELGDGEGLRPPQLGAVHAVLAHWTIDSKAATVVLPTGTGKTETMVAIMVAQPCKRLLVIVPTDALRKQISGKFVELGILKELGVVSPTALYPIVGTLKHVPQNLGEVESFIEKCNVVVTTMTIASQCTEEVKKQFVHWCSELFIDEAHHIGAPTWTEFKQIFDEKRLIQFTATPFRNDGKPVGGKIIFNYPLGSAQKDGYFRPIRFDPVSEFNPNKADQVIADKAVSQLRKDLQNYNHILMARVETIPRAKDIFKLYQKHKDLHPVQIHSGLSEKEKEFAKESVMKGTSKIVVCVDMLGEGFDLPELKIAAFHDIRKSLPVTLQLAGRFIRPRKDLGEPTFIANIADVKVQEEIRNLYSQDADWNELLKQSSESVINNQVDLWEFLKGFTNLPKEIPLQNINPALSTVIYKTKCAMWNPDNCVERLEKNASFEQIYTDINSAKNVMIVVIGRKSPVDWANSKIIYNMSWELLIFFWDQEQNLLFINGSENEGYYQELAHLVAGDVELIKNNEIFRSLYGINRLRLQNVGVINQVGRLIKYIMRAGPDIDSGMTDAQRKFVRKANIFGIGYENGKKATIGCSYKGRIWARKVGNIEELITWCNEVGKKVTNNSLDPDEILKGTLVSETIQTRPNKLPLYIDWPDRIYLYPETSYSFLIDNKTQLNLYESDLQIINPSIDKDITFEIVANESRIPLTFVISKENYVFQVKEGHQIKALQGAQEWDIQEFFEHFPPTIYFIDGSSLEGNCYTPLSKVPSSYSKEKIQEMDWTGIDITKESQGESKKINSIQFHLIEKLKSKAYQLIFDDDGSGEIADIVAVAHNENKIEIDLYHCKFSNGDTPGARIDDLYAVCGQAQKSVRWVERAYGKPEEIFLHLLRREAKRENEGESSRIEKGSKEEIGTLKFKSHSCPIEIRVYIIQPGLSKSKVSGEQLELLGATETFLLETYNLPFLIIGSS